MKSPEIFNKFQYVLGSASPRRKQLLEQLGLTFEVKTIEFDERVDLSIPIEQRPLSLARIKSMEFGELNSNICLITSDTSVILENEIINKPNNLMEATDMLRKLSGKTHAVVTGVHLRTESNEIGFSEKTEVKFRVLTEAEIEYYVHKFKPLDKAGAYGIQEWIGSVGVVSIKGCFYNVMGLPIAKMYAELSKL